VELICGIHAVVEALRAGRSLNRVIVQRGANLRRFHEILELCRQRGVPVHQEPAEALDRLAPAAKHQGVIAVGAAVAYVPLEDILARGGLVIFLDGVEDPRNLGAVIRTAAVAGASGVVIPERRAAPVTEAVAKAAAGGLAYTPVARVTNLGRALDQSKAVGYWIYGFDERGDREWDRVEWQEPVAMVFGGEGRGLRESTRKRCDFLVRIQGAGALSSLNVSVAAGIAMFEWVRWRRQQGLGK